MNLNSFGHFIHNTWLTLPEHYAHIALDEYVVMPNHFHGIIWIVRAGFKPARGLSNSMRTGLKSGATLESGPPLSEIIRGFKTFSARRINRHRQSPGQPVWQRNYYELVIRNDDELNRAREYIVYNPLKWALDKDNPNRIVTGP
jgi:REP element-mobilizing transposase RayT